MTAKAYDRNEAISEQNQRQSVRLEREKQESADRIRSGAERKIQAFEDRYYDLSSKDTDLRPFKQQVLSFQLSEGGVSVGSSIQKRLARLLLEIDRDIPRWMNQKAAECFYEKGLTTKGRELWRQVVNEYPNSSEADEA